MGKSKPIEPSRTVPLTGGGIAVTAAGPVAMIRAFSGERQVVLRGTLAQLGDLIDALIARRSAMARKHEPVPPISARAAVGMRPAPTVEDEPPIDRAPADLPPPIVLGPPVVRDREPPTPDFATAPAKPVRRPYTRPSPEALTAAADQIRPLHAKGWSDGAIAKAIGTSAGYVRTQRIAMGLATNFQSANPKLRRAA